MWGQVAARVALAIKVTGVILISPLLKVTSIETLSSLFSCPLVNFIALLIELRISAGIIILI